MSLLNHEKLYSLLKLAASVTAEGYFAECGVFEGDTLRAIANESPKRMVVGFDTFTGLPAEFWSAGEIHCNGEFSALFQRVIARMPSNVKLVAGLFPESASKYHEAKFAFVHVDLDYYLSTREAIRWLRPRMAKGGMMVFDDYGWPRCPGVKRAVDEIGFKVDVLVPYQAVWRNEC